MAAGFRSVDELNQFARDHHDGSSLATSPVDMLVRTLWRCPNPAHAPFLATPAHVMRSRGTWCPGCWAERRRPPNPQIRLEEVDALVRKRGGEIVHLHGKNGWQGLRTRLRVRCEYMHEWDVTGDNLMHAGSWCPQCRNKGERITRAIFEATFIGASFPKLKPDWMAAATGRKLELDGYNQTLRLAFEYQGYHHEKDEVKAVDALKAQACLRHGVKLVDVMGMKRPFPPTNVLKEVAAAFKKCGIETIPVLPVKDIFAPELNTLRQLARQRGGKLVSAVYCGAEPHEWHCGNQAHPTWLAEPWRIKKGSWCPSCAGNRRLGIEGLHEWGVKHGLELLDTKYRSASAVYVWRCKQSGHIVRRSKGNIQRSLMKMLPACNICGPGISANVLARKEAANKFALQTMSVIKTLKREGHVSLESLARELNERGVPTARGARWYASTVRVLISRAGILNTHKDGKAPTLAEHDDIGED